MLLPGGGTASLIEPNWPTSPAAQTANVRTNFLRLRDDIEEIQRELNARPAPIPGPTGPTGNPGTDGSPGGVGPTGNQGAQGPVGITGPTGEGGGGGPVLPMLGSVAPSVPPPAGTQHGTIYIDTLGLRMYVWLDEALAGVDMWYPIA
jgi:hypothetical protein